MPVEQLIVGWNRGGLGYVHELLKRAGVDVGLTFGPDTTREEFEAKMKTGSTVEVSPYVVPYLNHPVLDNHRVVFVYRDPLRVLNSLYFLGNFHSEKDTPVQRNAFRHLYQFYEKYGGKPAQASCSYLNNWKSMAFDYFPQIETIRVEEGPAALLKFILRRDVEVPFLPPTVNASGCRQNIVPSILPPKSRWGMLSLLIELGYHESDWFPRGGHAHYVNPDWHC